jgi:flagellar motor switch protein FliN/FliY
MRKMQAPESNKITKALGLAFSRTLAPALSDACVSNWQVGLAENASSPDATAEDVSLFKFSFTGSLQGAAFLAIPNAELPTLDLNGIEGPDAPATDYAKAFQASLDVCAQEMTKLLIEHGPVTIEVASVDATEFPSDHILKLRAEVEETTRQISFVMSFDQELLTSALASPAMAVLFPDLANLSAANLDLVLDVELNVTLRFGQRQLPLREVLDLTSGSVVELDRQVDEPVELVLDGRVVARGEAVIIDGNYGMRITEMLHAIVP